MALVHISYDAKDSDDSDALRRDIPKAYFTSGHKIYDFTEPQRSTFRFEIDGSAKDTGWARDVMDKFKNRCYYFISMSDAYLDENKEKKLPCRTNENKTLNKNFQSVLNEIKSDIKKGS